MDWQRNSKEERMYAVTRKEPIRASVILESEIVKGQCALKNQKAGISFWNAKGTSGDTIYYQGEELSFIKFWKKATKQALSGIYNKCANEKCKNDDSNYKLDGAHIVFNEPTGKVKPGDKLGIIPLCPLCNNAENTDEMILRYNVKVPIVVWKGVKK